MVSPRLRPSSALPTGDSLDSFISPGLASAEPTILYFTDFSVFWSLTWTVEPTDTTSVDTEPSSMTDAERSLSSSSAICFSSIAWSFLASSYSEFSEMSPKARASLIRSATSSLRAVERCSIFAFKSSRPCGVRMVSFGIANPFQLWRTRKCSEPSGGQRNAETIQSGACIGGRGSRAQLVVLGLGETHRLAVPRVELAQVAARALDAEVLLRALDHPAQLVRDLPPRGRLVALAEQPLEAPRVAERAAREHHGRRAGLLEGLDRMLLVAEAAGDDHRHVELLHDLRRQRVVGHPLVLLLRVARVEADGAHARLLLEPLRQVRAGALPGAVARAQLHGHRQPAPLACGASDPNGLVGVVEQGRS